MEQQLTPAGQNIVNDVALRYCISQDAVVHMLHAINNGGGTMAQFDCAELGGSGQWMKGGMIMVGDMLDHGLKTTVDNLCNELAGALSSIQMLPLAKAGAGGSNWWPVELGFPFNSGALNQIRYAIFPDRLAVESGGQVTVYDTLNHNVGGVSQQQGSHTSLYLSSQLGMTSVDSLPVVSGAGLPTADHANVPPPPVLEPGPELGRQASSGSSERSSDELIGLIEQLSKLYEDGAISEEEFASKKGELLARL